MRKTSKTALYAAAADQMREERHCQAIGAWMVVDPRIARERLRQLEALARDRQPVVEARQLELGEELR